MAGAEEEVELDKIYGQIRKEQEALGGSGKSEDELADMVAHRLKEKGVKSKHTHVCRACR